MQWMMTALISVFWMGPTPQTAGVEGIAVCTPDNPSENVVVYLTGPQVRSPQPPKGPVVLDQRNLRFVPHVLPIVRGTAVLFPNSDQIRHNVFSASPARMFNLGIYPSGARRTVIFNKPGVVELLCTVHPEMSAYVLILETPYFSATDARGTFRIAGIEPGTYTLGFWCEHNGTLTRTIKVRKGETLPVRALLHQDKVTYGTPPEAFENK
ncbi:MAG: methylamine utilization protein [Acidobacteriota bacterium]